MLAAAFYFPLLSLSQVTSRNNISDVHALVRSIIFDLGSSLLLSFPDGMMESKQFNPYAAGGLFGQNNMMQKSRKMTETLANGYSSDSTQ